MTHPIPAVIASLVLCAALLPGCLVSSSNHETYSGRYVSPERLAELQINSSTEADVVSKLGEPDQKATLPNGDAEWSWNYSKSVQHSGSVFLLASSNSSKTTPGQVVITLRDGIVRSKRYVSEGT